MRFRSAALFVILLSFIAVPAHAEKRVALVIGNQNYKTGVGPLTNPLNDIRLVGDALTSVGFDVLKPLQNATRAEMLNAIYAFASALKAAGPDAVGFLYYSGHGAASAGENYLIPVDVTEPSTLQLSIQGVKQSEVLDILRREAPNAAHYLILDACRNNLQGSRGGKGFVPVGQQSGVLVAFSTEPGKTASDTGTGSGPYAAALAAELVKPSQNDLLMFHNIRVDVMDTTNGDQVPWTEDGIQRRERPVFARASSSTDRPTQIVTAAPVQPNGSPTPSARSQDDMDKLRQELARDIAAGVYAYPPSPKMAAVNTPTSPSSPCGSSTASNVSLSLRYDKPLSATEECSLKPKDVFGNATSARDGGCAGRIV